MNTLIAQAAAPDSGSVNFLEFNRAIWGSTGDAVACQPWDIACHLVNMRNILVDGQIEGFETPGAIITAAFPYLFTIAGLILFGMLIAGGFQIMTGASDAKAAEAGKKRITSALIGFTLLFISFWVAQIVQIIFGINIGIGG